MKCPLCENYYQPEDNVMETIRIKDIKGSSLWMDVRVCTFCLRKVRKG